MPTSITTLFPPAPTSKTQIPLSESRQPQGSPAPTSQERRSISTRPSPSLPARATLVPGAFANALPSAWNALPRLLPTPSQPSPSVPFSRSEISDTVCHPSGRPLHSVLPSADFASGVTSDAPSWPGAQARPGEESASARAAERTRAVSLGRSRTPPPLGPERPPRPPPPARPGSYPGARHTLRPRGFSSWGAAGPGSSQSSRSSSNGSSGDGGPPAPRRRAGPAPRGPAPSMRRGAGAGRARVRPQRERPEAECAAGRGAAGGAPGRAGNSTSAP